MSLVSHSLRKRTFYRVRYRTLQGRSTVISSQVPNPTRKVNTALIITTLEGARLHQVSHNSVKILTHQWSPDSREDPRYIESVTHTSRVRSLTLEREFKTSRTTYASTLITTLRQRQELQNQTLEFVSGVFQHNMSIISQSLWDWRYLGSGNELYNESSKLHTPLTP
jgi:hypothetical protein